MKKYMVTVNGRRYEVEIESIGENVSSENNIEREEIKDSDLGIQNDNSNISHAKGEGIPVKATMPGTILDVKISNGQRIKKGDVLFILEAMKMENEIMAGEDGTVKNITVSRGSTVNTDDILATII